MGVGNFLLNDGGGPPGAAERPPPLRLGPIYVVDDGDVGGFTDSLEIYCFF